MHQRTIMLPQKIISDSYSVLLRKKLLLSLTALMMGHPFLQAQVSSNGALNNTGNLFVGGHFNNEATADLRNSGAIYTGFNIVCNGTSGYNGGTLYLNGTSPQVISGTSMLRTSSVVFNNSLGITISNALSIDGTATFTAGMVTAATIANPVEFTATGTHTGASDDKHVNGWVRKLGTGNFTYPVGDHTNYQPVGTILTANGSGMQVKYFNVDGGTAPFGTGGTSSQQLVAYNVKEYWEVAPVSSATGTVTIYWDAYNNPGIASTADLRTAHKNGGSWLNEGANNVTGTALGGSLTSNSLSSWSPFTLGSVGNGSPLPLNLVSFNATAVHCGALLTWETTHEQHMSHFEVERATGADPAYDKVKTVIAKNSIRPEIYTVSDDQLAAGSYRYRLKMVEADGGFSYSKTVTVSVKCAGPQIVIYPNPTTDIININGLSGTETIRLYNMTGQLVLSQKAGTAQQISLKAFAAGRYQLRIEDEQGHSVSAGIIKQ